MLNDYIKEQILQNFAFSPTSDQEETASSLADFVLSQDDKSVGVLLGYAGTGKTSLVGAFVRTMEQMEYNCVLMAPTGRAAKVFSLYSEHQAYTIHKTIYRQKSILQYDSFSLGFNSLKQTLFIVDEASMIDEGKVLDDLIQFVYGCERHCRLLLVGDTAQLPPVGETLSPALQPETLEMFGLTPFVAHLEQVVRQSEQSGILFNATMLRRLLSSGQTYEFPEFHLDGFPDIVKVPGEELIDTLASCYARYGTDDTIVICRSNKRAVVYNRGIRAQILDYEDELTSRDMVMIAKNNYFWKKPPLTPPNRGGLHPNDDDNENRIRAKYQTADPILYDVLRQYSQYHMKFPTDAETALWQMLRGKQLGTKFRRQHIIADFIVDFVSIQYKLVIEIDGEYHLTKEQKKADALRTQILNELGYREIRFCNEEVIGNPDGVRNSILSTIATCSDAGALPQSGELEGASVSFLANGDICRVRRVRNVRDLYGFRFADCVLSLPDYDDCEFEATVLLSTLHEEAPSLTSEHQQLLNEQVLADYEDIPNKQDRLKKLKEDPYFNALQLKYAYAVTCHKAQGGQWGHVFIDKGYMTEEMLGPDYYRWLYTAITRATEKVYLVNF